MSVAGSVADTRHATTPQSGRKKKRNTIDEAAESNYLDGLRAAKEQKTLDRITELLTGRAEVADLVLFQLESGKFDRSRAPTDSSVSKLRPSCNKLRLISKEYWEEILALVDGDAFKPEVVGCLSKGSCAQIACFIGRIELGSAPPSKKVPLIANWLQRRNISIGNRVGNFIWVRDTDNHIVGVNWEQCGPFCRVEEGGEGFIKHRDSGRCVPSPLGIAPNELLKDNFVESAASLQGEYSPILISSVFKRKNEELPSIANYARVPDQAELDLSPTADDAAPREADESVAPPVAPLASPASPAPPAGSGGSRVPSLPA